MFKFGENWASFSKQLNEQRIEEAERSLISLFGKDFLKDKSFLDIGCGSGLFSITAAQLGSYPVVGIDIDPISIITSKENAVSWLKDSSNLSFHQVSVLDIAGMESLGKFDIVYSWGVLHHTGSMIKAIRNAAECVNPDGLLMIAIYNRHWSSSGWRFVKWLYSHSGKLVQNTLVWIFAPIIFVSKWLVTLQNPIKMRRGMDFIHNVIDWIGGYPYEYADIKEMISLLNDLGFDVFDIRKANTPIGCNEFVCRLK